MSFEDFFPAQSLWSGACLNLLNVILFPRERTNFPLGDRRDTSYHLVFYPSQPIRNIRTPGCRLFKIPKNCGRQDFKLTCTHSSRGSAAKTIQRSHANPTSYAG